MKFENDILSIEESVFSGDELGKTIVLSGNIADLENEVFFKGRVYVEDGIISRIEKCHVAEEQYILPGFIDSHIHVESSMLVPSEFAHEAVRHGIVAVVADPHEIANVCGMEGIKFMLDNAKGAALKFYFGAPSCVPATSYDVAGAALGVEEIEELLADERITHLGEMMNFPGVVNANPEVMAKLAEAKKAGKPVDGHAPGVAGEALKKYVLAGITTDHEAIDICEAEEKIALGMKVLIREGSAAKNFENLYPLVNQYPSQVMFCSDDCHPDDLLKGSINLLVKRGLKKGLSIFNLLKAASKNPVEHYSLNVGLLREGDPADLVVVDSIESFSILKTLVNGVEVFIAPDWVKQEAVEFEHINNFCAEPITIEEIEVAEQKGKRIRVVEVIDKELYTKEVIVEPTIANGKVVQHIEGDILKIVVLNRYQKLPPAVAFVKNFGLKQGAICSSIAHDSHNIICIGADDNSIVELVNLLVAEGGGIGIHDGNAANIFALPIGGIMSATNAKSAASAYECMQEKAHALGSTLTAPFMTMAFLSLIVIPQLKLSSHGLFDVQSFKPVDLFV